ncbi:MAG: FAD:protein FMN transferase [Dehalobacter sp. 4CP]|nr:FAD:protein FMN transferase [Dehalobacter sp.]NBJ14403.1 FAD:protein FMN transferase [Dehalobacter sp. 4CP]
MYHKKSFKILLFLLIIIGLSSWQGYEYYQRNVNYQETKLFFDTEVYVEAHGWGAKKTVTEALGIMEELDSKLNKFSPHSEIYAINIHAGEQPVTVSELTFDVIEQSLKIADLSNGAFDPTIGPLAKLWKFGERDSSDKFVPSQEQITKTIQLVDYKKVILNKEQKTVFLVKKGMSLDLGAIAKGYAVSKALETFKSRNILSGMVSAGGNIYAIGKKDGGTPWHIGIRDPLNKGQIIGYVVLENLTIDTSGNYERFFTVDGIQYSHILDPRTGYPSKEVSGCTVVTENPIMADALATAAFVLGPEKGLQLIEKNNAWGLIIDTDGKMELSDKMKEMFKPETPE